jgi:hypothetical protein
MTLHLAFWLGAMFGGATMTITVLFWLAVMEKITSRKMLRTVENGHSVDVVLRTGERRTLLLAPEAAAQ